MTSFKPATDWHFGSCSFLKSLSFKSQKRNTCKVTLTACPMSSLFISPVLWIGKPSFGVSYAPHLMPRRTVRFSSASSNTGFANNKSIIPPKYFNKNKTDGNTTDKFIFGGIFMEKLFEELVTYGRHNSKGKKEFLKHIQKWGANNLSNFEVSIQQGIFVLNYSEVTNILLLFLNSVTLFFIIQETNTSSIVFDILYFFLLYIIQFRLSFLCMSFFIPSTNLIFTKESNRDNNEEIIICAHYDTKNSISKKPKGKLKAFIKYNAYGISRMLGMYLYKAEKLMLLFILCMYILYLSDFGRTAHTALILEKNPMLLGSFTYDLGITLLISSLFLMIIMWMVTYPFCKNINNQGADDNTSGISGALEIAKRLNNIDIGADIKIILFDNEERGLIGSTHYVSKNIKNLKKKNIKIINLDCIGRGSKIFISAENKDDSNFLKKLECNMNNKGITYFYYNVDYSDHKPFITGGFDAISLGRYDNRRYLWLKDFPMIDWIHGCEDRIDDIDYKKIQEVADIISDTIILHKKNAEILRTL